MTDVIDARTTASCSPSSKRRWWKGLLIATGSLHILILLLFTNFGRYREHFYCEQCGLHMMFTCYQIPLTSITLANNEHLETTPFSIAIQKHRLIHAHTHHWQFAYGRGNSVACASGGHENEAIYFRTGEKQLDLFIEMLVDYQGRGVTKQWCYRMLHSGNHPLTEPSSLPVPPQRLPRDEFNSFVADYSNDLLLTEQGINRTENK